MEMTRSYGLLERSPVAVRRFYSSDIGEVGNGSNSSCDFSDSVFSFSLRSLVCLTDSL